jgi:methyl-accepting chemotaxis protein
VIDTPEAGRGFAIVADAVKSLVRQSKVAAGSAINLVKGIKGLGNWSRGRR